jgi:hypothetical protein
MANPELFSRRAAGLYSQYNRFEVPPGALLIAENAVIDRPGIVEKRRGFKRYGPALNAAPSALLKFRRRLFVLDGSTLKMDSDGIGTQWTSKTGTFAAPTGSKMRGVETSKSLFFNSSVGLYKLDSLSNSPALAGVPPGLDVQLADSGAAGGMGTSYFAGYRVIFVRKDANGQEVFSAPSFKETWQDGGSNHGVNVTFTLPYGIIAGDYYEIYRTPQAKTIDAVGITFAKVVRGTVASGDVTAGYITYTDTVPAEGTQDLYTNPLQETESRENGRPPIAKCLAAFKGHLFLGSTVHPHKIQLRLLSAASLTADSHYLKVTAGGGDYIYTASTAESVANRKFQKFTGGTEAENVRNTAKSLVKMINRDGGTSSPVGNNVFYAQYISGDDDPPGIILLTAEVMGGSAFTLTSNNASCWDPVLPASGTTIASDNSEGKNRLYRSKYEKPEAVPFLSYDVIGSADYEILGLLATKDALLVYKQDGLWSLTGETDKGSGSSFSISELDPTVVLLAPGSVASLDNAAYAATSQGFVRSSDSGTKIQSWPIEVDIQVLAAGKSFGSLTWAVGYESDRKYLVSTQERPGDTTCIKIWCYNYLTEAWTRWDIPASCGIVIQDSYGVEKLYLGHAVDTYVLQERKAMSTSDSDYVDPEIGCTITTVDTTMTAAGVEVSMPTVTYTYTNPIAAGWIFRQGTPEAKVTEVVALGGTTYRLTLSKVLTLTANPAYLQQPIALEIEWAPEAGGNVGTSKQFSELQYYFDRNGGTHYLGYRADTQPGTTYDDPRVVAKNIGWGSPWGATPWGDERGAPSDPVRADIGRNHQHCRALIAAYKNVTAKENVKILQKTLLVRQYGYRTKVPE